MKKLLSFTSALTLGIVSSSVIQTNYISNQMISDSKTFNYKVSKLLNQYSQLQLKINQDNFIFQSDSKPGEYNSYLLNIKDPNNVSLKSYPLLDHLALTSIGDNLALGYDFKIWNNTDNLYYIDFSNLEKPKKEKINMVIELDHFEEIIPLQNKTAIVRTANKMYFIDFNNLKKPKVKTLSNSWIDSVEKINNHLLVFINKDNKLSLLNFQDPNNLVIKTSNDLSFFNEDKAFHHFLLINDNTFVVSANDYKLHLVKINEDNNFNVYNLNFEVNYTFWNVIKLTKSSFLINSSESDGSKLTYFDISNPNNIIIKKYSNITKTNNINFISKDSFFIRDYLWNVLYVNITNIDNPTVIKLPEVKAAGELPITVLSKNLAIFPFYNEDTYLLNYGY